MAEILKAKLQSKSGDLAHFKFYGLFCIFLLFGDLTLFRYLPSESLAASICTLGSLPKHAGNYKTRGSKLLSEADYVGAIACFEQANEINPNDPEVWNGRGVGLAKLKRYDEAIASYNKALSIPPGALALNSSSRKIQANDYYLWWFNRGTALADLGKYADAIDSYGQAIQIQPIFDHAWYFKGIALDKLKRPFQQAITAYDIANQIRIARVTKPKDLEYVHLEWYRRGINLATAKKYAEAVVAYDKAIQIKPDSFPLWFFKGNALYELQRYQEAVAAYDETIKLAPDFAQAWQDRGEALTQLKQYTEAIASYDKAITIDKFWQDQQSAANAWYGRGTALYSLDRYGEAIASLDRAIKIQPNFAQAIELRQLAQTRIIDKTNAR